MKRNKLYIGLFFGCCQLLIFLKQLIFRLFKGRVKWNTVHRANLLALRRIPVVAVSTLAAVAQTAADELNIDHLAVAMDARMGEIYCASYQRQKDLVTLVDEERVCPAEKFSRFSDDNWLGVGTAWREYEQPLSNNFALSHGQYFADYYPHAASIIKLAKREAEAGRTASADQALPVYLRNNVAKKKAQQ